MCIARPQALTAVCASLLLMAGCATGLGTHAGVTVQGEGSTLELAWSPDHPWARQFQSEANRFHVFAQYRIGDQPVEQDLGAGSLIGTPAVVRFQLPPALRSAPESQVCLFIGRSRAESAVPIRMGPQAAGDTARFRYAEWEAGVRSATVAAQSQRESDALDRSVASIQTETRRVRAVQDQSGIRSAEDCKRLRPSAVAQESTPNNVVDPSLAGAVAQRICVRRARNMRRSEVFERYRIDVEEKVASFASDAQQPKSERTKAQLRQFEQQWTRWFDKTGADYRPELGSDLDLLPVVDTVYAAIKAWNNGSQHSPADRAIIVRGLLDGFDGCLEDANKQLRTQYEAWERARSNKPARDKLYVEWQQASCLNELQNQNKALTALSDALAEAQTRQAKLQAQQGAAQAPAVLTKPGRKVLNDEVCSL